MKFFETRQIAEIDQFTIENEPISNIDLMERASLKLVDSLTEMIPIGSHINIFCGPGNNGGDGLAVARILEKASHFKVSVFVLEAGRSRSTSCQINLERLIGIQSVAYIQSSNDFPVILPQSWTIDALYGAGLTRPLDGISAQLVVYLNQTQAPIIAIDIPSGLHGEINTDDYYRNAIKATYTLTFQFPKLAFLFSENESFVGSWSVLDIGLHPAAIASISSKYHYIDREDIHVRFKPRSKFSHKGSFGHVLLIAGSYGKMGAAILASKSCLRSGAGLLTTHIPQKGYVVLQTAVPEAMVEIDESELMFTGTDQPEKYAAIAIGPGLGTKFNSQRGFFKLLSEGSKPMVIDADALNILGLEPAWLEQIPSGSILTPHPKEFERIAGTTSDCFQRLTKALELSKQYDVYFVVKGAHTLIACPNGNVWFNSTGNPGMATAGSGDVLTGIILALLGQGFSPEDAAVVGVYIHGLAGDFATEQVGEESLIASDIIDYLGLAFKCVHSKH